MKIDLTGKKALIGGSSKGIGLGIATQLANSGASVCLIARNESKLKEILNQLPNSSNHSYLIVDFSNFKEYKIKIEKYIKNNQVNILVNNTQGPPAGNSLSKNIDSYQEAFDLLFKSVVYTTSLVVPQMQKNKWGRIINISSTSAALGNKGQANYAAAKAGIEAMSRSLARELGARNINVNCVAPGFVETDMTKDIIDGNEDLLASQIPLGRLGKPEEIADVVNFLASEEANYITGQTIHVNGGLFM